MDPIYRGQDVRGLTFDIKETVDGVVVDHDFAGAVFSADTRAEAPLEEHHFEALPVSIEVDEAGNHFAVVSLDMTDTQTSEFSSRAHCLTIWRDEGEYHEPALSDLLPVI